MGKVSKIFEVTNWFDGVREGVTEIDGNRYIFKSRYLDAKENKGDFESVDLFDLTPVKSAGLSSLLATAVFKNIKFSKNYELQLGAEVIWYVI